MNKLPKREKGERGLDIKLHDSAEYFNMQWMILQNLRSGMTSKPELYCDIALQERSL